MDVEGGLLVFRAGPVDWGRLQASIEGAELHEAGGWLRSTPTREVSVGSSGTLTVILGLGLAAGAQTVSAAFRYSAAAKNEESRLALVETSPEGVVVEPDGKAWARGEERPLEVLRFEDEGYPVPASLRRLASVRMTLAGNWGVFNAAYHPILE